MVKWKCIKIKTEVKKCIGWINNLDKIQTAQFDLWPKLPLALCVSIIQLPRKLLRILVLTDLLGLVPETGCLGCSGEYSTLTGSASAACNNYSEISVASVFVGPTQGSGWGTVDCTLTTRRPHCYQPKWETWCCPRSFDRDCLLHHGSSQNWKKCKYHESRFSLEDSNSLVNYYLKKV